MNRNNRLRVLRAEHRLTQMALARRIKIGSYRYWQIENGYTEPTPDELDALVKALKVSSHEDIFPKALAS